MKTIDTLVPDIYSVISGSTPNAISNTEVKVSYDKWFTPRDSKREEGVLYFSEVGTPCPRQLWYKYNAPEIATKPDGNLLLKFFYGDILEELVLNVSENAGHTVETLARKVRIATILGTFQSTLTHFPYLRKIWNKNTEEERLLGVSLTGILDNHWMGEVCDSTAKGVYVFVYCLFLGFIIRTNFS